MLSCTGSAVALPVRVPAREQRLAVAARQEHRMPVDASYEGVEIPMQRVQDLDQLLSLGGSSRRSIGRGSVHRRARCEQPLKLLYRPYFPCASWAMTAGQSRSADLAGQGTRMSGGREPVIGGTDDPGGKLRIPSLLSPRARWVPAPGTRSLPHRLGLQQSDCTKAKPPA